jgi:cytochrome c oxidase subunit 2
MLDWLTNLIYPQRASTMAGHVDALYTFLIVIAGFFTVLIYVLVTYFAVRYRRSRHPQAQQVESSLALELTWSGVPLLIAMGIFIWGAELYWQFYNTPPAATESQIFVVGKQWMWKIHHPEGPREINELHVPLGRPIQLTMTSEDVIHSFFIPAFRVKQDVLPGRYVSMWFQPTKPGTYHLFCAEYCGTDHSSMGGHVIVMEPAQYQEWLTTGQTYPSMASAGQQLYVQLGCQTCHTGQPGASSPPLLGRFTAKDEPYLRESILDPGVKIAPGYPPIMPTYRGLISEEGILQIIEYLKASRLTATTQPVTP